jgi:hypothetical protein
MGEPQPSADVESDRRSSPRFPAELLGKASVRLLGGSEVTLINFSERGILFQSETRLLVGARGTIRIVVGTETTIAAGTVVRSLVQGMASGKLAFHTALALDQPLAIAAAVEARERARIAALPPPEASAPLAEDVLDEPVEAPPVAVIAEPAAPTGKIIEKRSHRAATREVLADPAPVATAPTIAEPVAEAIIEPEPAPLVEQREPVVEHTDPEAARSTPVSAPPLPVTDGGFGDTGFGGGSFGWSDPVAEPAAAGLSVLFVSTTKERTSRLQGILAAHRRDIVLTTVMHSKAEAIADIARQHDVLLFDFAIGPDALERTLTALRSSPLGASVAIYVPQQTALPPAVSSLANACVVDTTSGNMLAAALRDAAWTPWQPVDASADNESGTLPDAIRDDLFWKAFDALPVPVFVVDAAGTILHANAACMKLAAGIPTVDQPLASLFVAEDGPAIAKLIADGLAGGYQDTPVFTAPADGQTVQVVLQALSVLPGAGDRRELALRCELRAEPAEVEAAVLPDYAADIAALTEARDELTRTVEASRDELTRLREELAQLRGELNETRAHSEDARRERDELRAELAIALRERDEQSARGETLQRELAAARELERAGATKVVELERLVSDAARSEVAAARAQSQLAATTEELAALRNELDGQRMRVATQGVDAERTAAKYAAIESSARQAIEELKTARGEAQRLTRERDQALAAVEAERARADAALTAVRDEGKKSRKIVTDDAVALTAAKLQRQVEELRAELQQEQDARKELEELLDQNAANLEQTIQGYEERLEGLGAGVEDKRPAKPKKSQRG